MKKFISVFSKSIIFFMIWIIATMLIPVPETSSPVVWRLWAEITPFSSVAILTVIFLLIEKNSCIF